MENLALNLRDEMCEIIERHGSSLEVDVTSLLSFLRQHVTEREEAPFKLKDVLSVGSSINGSLS